MKIFASAFMSFVLTTAMLTGCGCTNRNTEMTTAATLSPTTHTTPSVTTEPASMPTVPSSSETIAHGNGPLEESTGTEGNPSEATSAASGAAAQ